MCLIRQLHHLAPSLSVPANHLPNRGVGTWRAVYACLVWLMPAQPSGRILQGAIHRSSALSNDAYIQVATNPASGELYQVQITICKLATWSLLIYIYINQQSNHLYRTENLHRAPTLDPRPIPLYYIPNSTCTHNSRLDSLLDECRGYSHSPFLLLSTGRGNLIFQCFDSKCLYFTAPQAARDDHINIGVSVCSVLDTLLARHLSDETYWIDESKKFN